MFCHHVLRSNAHSVWTEIQLLAPRQHRFLLVIWMCTGFQCYFSQVLKLSRVPQEAAFFFYFDIGFSKKESLGLRSQSKLDFWNRQGECKMSNTALHFLTYSSIFAVRNHFHGTKTFQEIPLFSLPVVSWLMWYTINSWIPDLFNMTSSSQSRYSSLY